MDRRLALRDKLREILGNSNTYFQPPSSERLKYPCIIYNKEPGDTKRADDRVYLHHEKWNLLVCDEDPDSEIPNKILDEFSKIQPGPYSTVSGLNQYTFTLYF